MSGAVGQAAFDVVDLLHGVAEELFLACAMRTPKCAIEFDVFFAETVGEIVVVRGWFEVEVEERDEREDEQNDEPGFCEFEEFLFGYFMFLFAVLEKQDTEENDNDDMNSCTVEADGLENDFDCDKVDDGN